MPQFVFRLNLEISFCKFRYTVCYIINLSCEQINNKCKKSIQKNCNFFVKINL